MAETELKVQFPNTKLDALRYFAEKEGTTVEDELQSYLDKFYQKNVPQQVRDYVEHRDSPKTARQESAPSQAAEQQDRPIALVLGHCTTSA